MKRAAPVQAGIVMMPSGKRPKFTKNQTAELVKAGAASLQQFCSMYFRTPPTEVDSGMLVGYFPKVVQQCFDELRGKLSLQQDFVFFSKISGHERAAAAEATVKRQEEELKRYRAEPFLAAYSPTRHWTLDEMYWDYEPKGLSRNQQKARSHAKLAREGVIRQVKKAVSRLHVKANGAHQNWLGVLGAYSTLEDIQSCLESFCKKCVMAREALDIEALRGCMVERVDVDDCAFGIH